jgi:hypothetical protein
MRNQRSDLTHLRRMRDALAGQVARSESRLSGWGSAGSPLERYRALLVDALNQELVQAPTEIGRRPVNRGCDARSRR